MTADASASEEPGVSCDTADVERNRMSTQPTPRRLIRALYVAIMLGAVTAVVVLAVRNRQLRAAKDELARDIEIHCASLASDLRFQADQYAKGVDWLSHPELTPDQRERIDQVQFSSWLTGDMTPSSRHIAGMALWNRFYFCLSARDIDEKRMNQFSDRFERARDTLSDSEDRSDLARAVREMADLALSVRDLPLREQPTKSPID